jgi:hypothetical protein
VKLAGRLPKSAAVVILLATVLVVTAFSVALISGASPFGFGSPGVTSPSSTTTSATIVDGSFSDATPIPSAFWGVDVEPTQRFNSQDAAAVGATPVTYIRFPGGALGEEFNYTSGVITAPNGAQTKADTSTAEFVAACKTIGCHAILQIPTEIDNTHAAAYYVSYVVHTLGYQPAFWEIGNDPAAWTHFDVPWSEWKTKGGGNVTPLPYANLVHTYIAAILKVDPSAKFLALGSGMGDLQNGVPTYAKPWVEELAKVDGSELAGVSVHSYIQGKTPSDPTDADLFANLRGIYSIPDEVAADRADIKAGCSSCTNMNVYITEDNAAEDNSYTNLLTSFAGTLYLAAETTQALSLQVPNVDWFCYHCGFAGAWSQNTLKWQKQYYLFSDLATQLKSETLPTTVSGPSTLYGIATYSSSGGLALMLVNVDTSATVTVNIANSGFVIDRSGVTEYSWVNGASLPSKSTVTLSSTVKVPALSILLLTVGSSGTKSPGDAAGSNATGASVPSVNLSNGGPTITANPTGYSVVARTADGASLLMARGAF